MTHTTTTPTSDATPQAALPPARKLYHAPEATVLGAIEALTAGPNAGSLDQLVGGSGGFQTDSTS